MRIAQVITLYLPAFVGGATLVAHRIGLGLRARGHDVAVFCGRPDGDAEPYATHEWQVDGIPVTGVNVASGYVLLDVRNYLHPEVDGAFDRFLERERPDVVHVHSIQALGASLLDVADRRGIPIVVTMHDFWWFCVRLFLVDPAAFVCPLRVTPARCHCAPGYDFPTRRRYLGARLGRAARVLTPSRFLAGAVIANGVPRERVEVSPNGIVLPRDGARRRPGPVRFGYFGGPDNAVKGLPTLLDAAERLDVGGWRLRLFGVDGATTRIPLAIRDRVEIAPRFMPDRLGTVLSEIDCLVVPSLARESYSLATREALAAGVPVVASDGGGATEVIRRGTNGYVFATGDAADLAACMRPIVLEPELLDRLREGAAATPIPTVDDQVERLEQIYREVAAPKEAQRGPESAAARRDVVSPARRLVDVLFIAGIDGAPLRYRVVNLQDGLRAAELTSRLLHQTDPAIPEAIAGAGLVVMYRVALGGYAAACVAEVRRQGVPLAFSCDDLVFDPDAIPTDVLERLPAAQRDGALAVAAGYRAMLAASDAFIGTTEPLVDAAKAAGIPGFVVRNGLGEAQLAVAETIAKSRPSRDGADASMIRVAYFSGTATHDLDFAAIEPTLAWLLDRYADVRLVLGGHLRPSAAFGRHAGRIERLSFIPWQRLLATLAEVDVNVAPLRLEPFSDAKSEVKYLEAAVVGVPTIASPTSAFRHAIRAGENGLLARTAADWRAALEALVVHAGLRRRLGNAARDDAFTRYSPAAQSHAIVDAIAAIHALPRRAAGRTQADVARAASTAGPAGDGACSPAGAVRKHPGEVGRYALEPDDAMPGAAELGQDAPSPYLVAGRSVGQRFTAPTDGLTRIDVRIGTDGRTLRGRLTIRLAEAPAATPLRTVELDLAEYPDHAWVAADFEPLAESSGRSLYVWIESDIEDAHAAPTVWTYTAGWGAAPSEGLHVDHRPVPGSLTFRTFHTR